MPYRILPLVDGQIYHIYNRGVEKKPIYISSRDYQRFIKTLRYYQILGPKPKFSKYSQPKAQAMNIDPSKRIVDILAYCLMPNHFHFLIKQVNEGGITEFMSKLCNSYTKYFNTKYARVGPLLQGEFKAVLVESDEQLLHLSRYIHLNPLVSYVTKNLNLYPWSSYKEYFNDEINICAKEEVLNFFKTSAEYEQFVLDQADYGEKLELIKHQLIDQDN